MKHLPGDLALTAVAVLLLAGPVQPRRLSADRAQLAQRDVCVSGSVRSDGCSVQPHMQSASDDNAYDNPSGSGNVNPHTGKVTVGHPEILPQHYSIDTTAPFHTWSGYQSR
jgi:hypothetical protein